MADLSNESILIIIAAVIGGIGYFGKYYIERKRLKNTLYKIIEELIRHLGKNEEVIDDLKLRLDKGEKISTVRFKNLKVDENSIIFYGNYFLALNEAHKIDHCRVILRNMTNWIDEAIKCHQSENCDNDELKTLIKEVEIRQNHLKNRLEEILQKK